jgi:hypothetical protein
VAVVDKIGDYLTPASVIAEARLISAVILQGHKNVFSDALCHRRNKVSFFISRLGLANLLSFILIQ